MVPSISGCWHNSTVIPNGSFSYLTLWPAGETQPYVSTLNALDGAIVPTKNGSIDAFASDSTNLILDLQLLRPIVLERFEIDQQNRNSPPLILDGFLFRFARLSVEC